MHWFENILLLISSCEYNGVNRYDLIHDILITVMHVIALDTVNSNLLFGISSVAVHVAEHLIRRYFYCLNIL